MKKQAKYNLDAGIHEVRKHIETAVQSSDTPVLVLVAGGTASGKTSAVAKKIQDAFRESQILSMDNYYRGREYYEKHKLNFDQPEALDLDLFFKHLNELKSGKTVKIPEYDFKTGVPVYDKIEIQPSKVIIVEWLFALDDTLSKLWDVKVFVDLWVQSQILRRLFRDVERTWQKPSSILKYFLDVVYEMHKKYIEPTKKNANIIIENNYSPTIESKNAKIKEDRVRYKLSIENPKEILNELIYKLWGTYVWKMEQTDYFFDPNGKYNETGELMIIRKFGFERYFFIYFWPNDKKTVYDDRYTMKFFTDFQTLNSFKKLYPKGIVTISRLRRSFYIWGVLVSLDKLENGESYITFKFDSKKTRKIILVILEALGINPLDKVEKSYFQLQKV